MWFANAEVACAKRCRGPTPELGVVVLGRRRARLQTHGDARRVGPKGAVVSFRNDSFENPNPV